MASILRFPYRKAIATLPPTMSVVLQYFRHHRRLPNLSTPSRFTEKVQYTKLNTRDPRTTKLADKISVKEFVASQLGNEWLTPTIFAGDALPPLKQRSWPIPFVIKAAHGSGWNIFVRHASELDWPAIEVACQKWLSESFGTTTMEWVYWQIPRRILVEPFLGSPNGLPIDYKLFVFSGRVHYIQVDTDRATNHKRVFFDRTWRRQPFSYGYPPDPRVIEKPRCLDQMIEAAEHLGKGFSFVRIDFYEIDGKPKFGEFTFLPDSGLLPFSPDQYDAILGSLWSVP